MHSSLDGRSDDRQGGDRQTDRGLIELRALVRRSVCLPTRETGALEG